MTDAAADATGADATAAGFEAADATRTGAPADAAAPDPLRELVAVMDRLRSPGGCPWDAAQTHASLAPYAIEEAHELVEAIEAGDRAGLREELGDVLLQVVFHARVAAEDADDPFDVDDVARDLVAKLVRRHPHVFADADAPGDEVGQHAAWDRIKKAEKARASVFDGVPASLGALARAQKVAGRAARAGLVPEDAAERADAPVPAPEEDVPAVDEGGPRADLGARLLALVLEAHEAGLDAEGELRRAAKAWEDALRERERSGL